MRETMHKTVTSCLLVLPLLFHAAHSPAEEPTVNAEWSHSFSKEYPFLDGSWYGIVAASDGNTYFAVCTHSPDHHAQFFRYDPKKRRVEHVADIGRACGESGKGLTPQGKVHTPIFEYKQKLYMATLQARYKQEDEKRYPGGHFLEYDLRTGKFKDLGIPFPGKSYFTLAADLPRAKLYGIAWPGESGEGDRHGVCFDLNTRKFSDLGLFEPHAKNQKTARTTLCSPAGDVFWTVARGQICRYRHSTPARELLNAFLPMPPEKAPLASGPSLQTIGDNRRLRTGVWDRVSRKYYILDKANEQLSSFDPESLELVPLCDMGTWSSWRSRCPRPATLGMCLAGRKVYYAPWGKGRTSDLVCYDTDKKQLSRLGPLTVGPRAVAELHSMVQGSDGKLHAVAFVYASEESGDVLVDRKIRIGGKHFEMRFLVISPRPSE